MRFSLILATVGRVSELHRWTISAIAQTCQDFELIIVDQNGDDRLSEIAALARDGGIELVHLKTERRGLSAARNAGLKLARGDLVAFPDDDCWYEPETLASALEALDHHPEWSGLVGAWAELPEAADDAAPVGERLAWKDWRQFKGGDASSIRLFMRNTFVRNIGDFDEDLGLGTWYGAGEETDLIMRALSLGHVIGRAPTVRVHHAYDSGQPPFGNAGWRELLRRGRGTGALYVKHRLSPFVALRGILAPLIRAMVAMHGIHRGTALSLGIAQGALAWSLRSVRALPQPDRGNRPM